MGNEIIYWKQKDGTLISVDDMDLNHLRNTLKMILRSANKPKIPEGIQKRIDAITREFEEESILDDYNEECDASEVDLY